MNQVYGYVRVSTRDQNEARQMTAMRDWHVPEEDIFLDKQSGKDFECPSTGGFKNAWYRTICCT